MHFLILLEMLLAEIVDSRSACCKSPVFPLVHGRSLNTRLVLLSGEDVQDAVSFVRFTNSSLTISNPVSSPTNGEQISNNASLVDTDGRDRNKILPLPPPLPTFFLGYSLPPGHPCNTFTLPPPPADKKRTGPRRKC